MKKATIGVGVILSIAIVGGQQVSATSAGLIDGRFDFEYLVREIVPSNERYSGGKFSISNNAVGYDGHKTMLYIYRLDTSRDDYRSIEPMPYTRFLGLTSIHSSARTPLDLGLIEANDGRLGIDTDNADFYYTVYAMIGSQQYWAGTRKVSYSGCLEDAKFAPNVVCRLREQIDGVFYYDAYVGGVLMSQPKTVEEVPVVSTTDNEGGRGDDGGDENSLSSTVNGKAESAGVDNGGLAAVVKNTNTDNGAKKRIVAVGGNVRSEGKDSSNLATTVGKIAKTETLEGLDKEVDEIRGMDRERVELPWLWWMLLVPIVGIGFLWFLLAAIKRRKEEKTRKRFAKYAKM